MGKVRKHFDIQYAQLMRFVGAVLYTFVVFLSGGLKRQAIIFFSRILYNMPPTRHNRRSSNRPFAGHNNTEYV